MCRHLTFMPVWWLLYCCCCCCGPSGRGEGAGGPDRHEAGDGAVHEDAGEGCLRKAGRPGGAPDADGGHPHLQPTADPQGTGNGPPAIASPSEWSRVTESDRERSRVIESDREWPRGISRGIERDPSREGSREGSCHVIPMCCRAPRPAPNKRETSSPAWRTR